MANPRICSIDGCDKLHEARGWCNAHYKRFLKTGDPMPALPLMTPSGEPRRFMEEVALSYDLNDCLIWPYSRNGHGYALIDVSGRTRVVSRLICERVHGPAPDNKQESAHSCGNGHLGCVSPRHLSWKSSKENAADRDRHKRTASGTRNGRAKLDDTQVAAIIAAVGISQAKIADIYGITQSHVSRLRSRKIRKQPIQL